jgi:hypothetical protein
MEAVVWVTILGDLDDRTADVSSVLFMPPENGQSLRSENQNRLDESTIAVLTQKEVCIVGKPFRQRKRDPVSESFQRKGINEQLPVADHPVSAVF